MKNELQMERTFFDMNQCKPGDLLVSCHGAKLEYVCRIEGNEPYNHRVKYIANGVGEGSRTDEGWAFKKRPMPEDHDIVGFFTGTDLCDAVKKPVAVKGHALLQWGFIDKNFSYSVQMPEDVVDQILEWRDKNRG